jgi:hypothetical protein
MLLKCICDIYSDPSNGVPTLYWCISALSLVLAPRLVRRCHTTGAISRLQCSRQYRFLTLSRVLLTQKSNPEGPPWSSVSTFLGCSMEGLLDCLISPSADSQWLYSKQSVTNRDSN